MFLFLYTLDRARNPKIRARVMLACLGCRAARTRLPQHARALVDSRGAVHDRLRRTAKLARRERAIITTRWIDPQADRAGNLARVQGCAEALMVFAHACDASSLSTIAELSDELRLTIEIILKK